MFISRVALEQLYCNQRLSQRAVARELNVGNSTVRRYLKKYGIPTLERDVFEWNQDAAYILGALLGDGSAYLSHNATSLLLQRVGHRLRLKLARKEDEKRKALYRLVSTSHSEIDYLLEEIADVREVLYG